MQTASGQTVKDSSNRDAGNSGARRGRRRGLNPWTIAIAGILLVVALASMALVFLGVWPPKSSHEPSVAERWAAQTTATPAAQRAAGLKVEKLGAPTKDGDTIVVRVRVTNGVQANGGLLGTPTPGVPTPTAGPANIKSASIRVLFYNVDDKGNQVVVGGGVGSVVDLSFGESKEVEIRSTGIEGFTDQTQYEAFPETVWTDKDPAKGGAGAPLAVLLPASPSSH